MKHAHPSIIEVRAAEINQLAPAVLAEVQTPLPFAVTEPSVANRSLSVDLIHGDVIEVLREMPPGKVSAVITSPPYYGLRAYGIPPRQWTDGETCVLGEEKTLDGYIGHLVEVFREVRRVLHNRGSLWLNLGDCYAGGGKHVERSEIYNIPGDAKPKRPKQFGLTGKDLLMVPARAALALQQPYYEGIIKAERDRTWMSALVDGEGCITILQTTAAGWSGYSYPAVMTIGMTDRECTDYVKQITGLVGGSMNPYQHRSANRPTYKWRISGSRAGDLSAELYPYLMIKKKQALIAWNHEQVRNTWVGRGAPVTQESLEKQQQCRDLIRRLNRREVADIPHWMSEPPSLYKLGWILRNDVIWCKGASFCPSFSGSVMPESTKDRATWSHEHLFHFVQNESYFYDQDGCREPYAESTRRQVFGADYKGLGRKNYKAAGAQNPSDVKRRILAGAASGTGRNLRNVWIIPKQNYPGHHFATFPEKLVEPIVKLATPEKGVCSGCAAPLHRRVEREPVPASIKAAFEESRQNTAADTGRTDGHTGRRPNYRRRVIREEWVPSCSCQVDVVPATVLDIFNGSGRTGIVSVKLGRSYVGIDINADYIRMAAAAIEEAR